VRRLRVTGDFTLDARASRCPSSGAALDDVRIGCLWMREASLSCTAETAEIPECVRCHPLAGGLSRERQKRVLAPELANIGEPTSLPPELVLLAGSLEPCKVPSTTGGFGESLPTDLIMRDNACERQSPTSGRRCNRRSG
jgi:hypothetical protein